MVNRVSIIKNARDNALDLSRRDLGQKTGAELKKIFSGLPNSFTIVVLSENDLWQKTGAELKEAFSRLPDSMTTLNLSYNKLGLKTPAELKEIFSGLPASITTFNLSWNNLGQRTGDELKEAFLVLPNTITTLDLSGNALGKKTSAELKAVFSSLPDSMTTLNLSWNDLSLKTGAELKEAFSSFPGTITTLVLSRNKLGEKTSAELKEIFSGLPNSITTLNLSRNKLGEKTPTELKEAFSGLPHSITTLNLSENHLEQKTPAELFEIFTTISSRIEVIGFSEKFSENTLSKGLNIAISRAETIEAKTNPLEKFKELENVLTRVSQICQDPFKQTDVYKKADQLLEVLRSLSEVQKVKDMLSTQDSDPKSRINNSPEQAQSVIQYRNELTYKAYISFAEKFSAIDSDYAKESMLDMANNLFHRGGQQHKIKTPEAYAELLGVCEKILSCIPDDYPNKSILNEKKILQSSIEANRNIILPTGLRLG
jgi:Ran GTPase-activating protein (RanGAP) involved in mRNA processing and transport